MIISQTDMGGNEWSQNSNIIERKYTNCVPTNELEVWKSRQIAITKFYKYYNIDKYFENHTAMNERSVK